MVKADIELLRICSTLLSATSPLLSHHRRTIHTELQANSCRPRCGECWVWQPDAPRPDYRLHRSCLAASPRFGPLAIPLFLEKLQANTNTARRQSLQALEQALPIYGKATVTASAVNLWEAINLEVRSVVQCLNRSLSERLLQIFHATETDVEELALRALRALLRTVYAEVDTQEDISQDKASKLAQKLCDTCLLELKEADKSNATPATNILAAAVSASGVFESDLHLGAS